MTAFPSKWAIALCTASLLALGSATTAQMPDVIVYDVGVDGGNTNDINYWGQNAGIAAYSIATQSCNKGTATLQWITAGGSTLHPVIGQNMFRYKNGSFEHIGQSWLKHGFCAVNEIETFCAPCQSTPCDSLGIGCADTYWATLNDGGGGQSKININATQGSHVHGGGPSGNATIRGRLQVAVTDIDPAQNVGAQYFIEGQYVTRDETLIGNAGNSASWRRVSVLAVNNIDGGGPTHREEPAMWAWKNQDPLAEIQLIKNQETGGLQTFFLLGWRVTQVGGGLWHYEYAIQNLNSDQSAASFSVPVDTGTTVSSIGFHDVAYHSGDPYSGTDWPGAKTGGEIRWATTPFSTDPNANAIRWGTLYNFRFNASVAPTLGTVTIGLFKTGPNTSIAMNNVLVPGGDPRTIDPHTGGVGSAGNPTSGGTMTPASVTIPRMGMMVNPVALSERTPALIGQTWEAALEFDGARHSLLFIGLGGPTEGAFNRMGEVLILPPLMRGKLDDLTLAIPDDPRLIGVEFSAQAALQSGSGWKLTNALDVTIGSN
ncbi:MAG: hypothetical protein HOP15_04075 [Planctomycetes bacterium]|nr:hypothetical protein [Planctomycetota bacterium]